MVHIATGINGAPLVGSGRPVLLPEAGAARARGALGLRDNPGAKFPAATPSPVSTGWAGGSWARSRRPRSSAAGGTSRSPLLHDLLVYPRTAALATRAFRWLMRRGVVVGSSGREEFDVTQPREYALPPCRVQCRLGQREIRRIGENLDVRVANKAEALARAARCGVEIGPWFESPLHPGETDLARFGYRRGMCPQAERAAREVINLPPGGGVGMLGSVHRRRSNCSSGIPS